MCLGIVIVLVPAALPGVSAQKYFTTLRVSAEKAGPVRQELQPKTVLSQSDNITTPSCTVQRALNVCGRRRRTVLLQMYDSAAGVLWHVSSHEPRLSVPVVDGSHRADVVLQKNISVPSHVSLHVVWFIVPETAFSHLKVALLQ